MSITEYMKNTCKSPVHYVTYLPCHNSKLWSHLLSWIMHFMYKLFNEYRTEQE